MLSRKLVNPLPQTFWGLFFPVTSSAGSVCTFPPYFLAQRVTITQASRAASVPAAMPQAWRTVTAGKGCHPGGGVLRCTPALGGEAHLHTARFGRSLQPLLALPPSPALSCAQVCISITRRGRASQQYVMGVIITSPTPIMPSAADLSPFLSFNHPPASLTLTEQRHRPCDLSARGHDL